MNRSARSWRDQLAPGRVFQLKRKTYRGNPVCVLITDAPDRWARYPMCVEVNQNGCVTRMSPDRARLYVGGLRHEDFTARLVTARRHDLEQFDAMDLSMIRYGCPMYFTGQLDKHEWESAFPSIPGVEWTVFWTHYDNLFSTFLPHDVKALFHGAWHFTASKDTRYPQVRVRAWATAETDRSKLREIHRALARILPIQTGTTRVVARDMGDHYVIAPIGNAGPAISNRWLNRISKTNGSETFTWLSAKSD